VIEPAPAGGGEGASGRHSYVAADKGTIDDEPRPDVPATLPGLPFGAYAYDRPPERQNLAIVNATVWTSGPQGIIEGGSVLVSEGKIRRVVKGKLEVPAGYRVIDGAGQHLTPGLIDCHSHTGISGGVNEGGQAVTAEVRIGDVTNPDAISWYRQLAGGITTVSNLHGSANVIGGQNQVNKNRWGAVGPDDLHFAGAIAGIKFALGENVKQSNWGDRNDWRYPQTRMGVEALLRDRFGAAKVYQREKLAAAAGGTPFRTDFELEALVEILEGKRLIHCHSYRQDEILMLARLSAELGFKLGTYQHILEGYKVADAVRDSAIGASAFSDWWGFKVEVQDAVPYAGPIMHEQGVVVSYNSDSDEMARRMNVEAAKAQRYSELPGGRESVGAEEALKFVTINPARQLKIEDRVGSIEVGKDADLVLWSGDPLSTLSRVTRTFIDGAEWWSLQRDGELRAGNAQARARLVQKILADPAKRREREGAGQPGGAGPTAPEPVKAPATPPQAAGERLLDRMLTERWAAQRAARLDMVRRGKDPHAALPGECGCDMP
jgi:N-acetylglucosamine-6-phosphate deacetylase